MKKLLKLNLIMILTSVLCACSTFNNSKFFKTKREEYRHVPHQPSLKLPADYNTDKLKNYYHIQPPAEKNHLVSNANIEDLVVPPIEKHV